MADLRRSLAVAAMGLALLAAGCSSGGSDAEQHASGPSAPQDRSTFPGATWKTATPASLGLKAKTLDTLAAEAKAADSDCFAVVRHGQLAGSWQWHGNSPSTQVEAWSATKSFTSILTGIAQADGDLKITDKASKYVPAWRGTPSDAVTVKNLLSNDSGRHWDFHTDYFTMTGAPDRSKLAESLAQDSPPGKIWVYNNSAIQVLSEVLQTATGTEPAAFAQTRLFAPIGMDHSVMTKDTNGNTSTFMGLHSTCEDMARFGLLMLRNGNWDGKQVVPANWVRQATGKPSQSLNASYGYLFWLNRKGRLPVEETQATHPGETKQASHVGQMQPDAPDDMFWALGLGDQIIQMDPGSDTVVVRMGPAKPKAGSTRFNEKYTARVVTEGLVKGSH
jgi:CubicO group peptidase (beta-lactamase class C family)